MRHLVTASLVTAAIALAGCAGSGPECPSGQVYAEGPQAGQCASSEAVRHSEAQSHQEDRVQQEASEVEEALKKRHADATAAELEAAAGG